MPDAAELFSDSEPVSAEVASWCKSVIGCLHFFVRASRWDVQPCNPYTKELLLRCADLHPRKSHKLCGIDITMLLWVLCHGAWVWVILRCTQPGMLCRREAHVTPLSDVAIETRVLRVRFMGSLSRSSSSLEFREYLIQFRESHSLTATLPWGQLRH
jgi:hypothetical protein